LILWPLDCIVISVKNLFLNFSEKSIIYFLISTIFVLISVYQAKTFATTTCEKQSSSGEFHSTDPNNGRVFQLSALTLERTQRLYQALTNTLSPESYRYNLDSGCYERAQLISDLLFRENIKTLSVNLRTENGGEVGATGASFMNGGADEGNVFEFESIYEENRTYTWGRHAAVAVCVVTNANARRGELHILDPSTFRQSVPLELWKNTFVSTLPAPRDLTSWSINFY